MDDLKPGHEQSLHIWVECRGAQALISHGLHPVLTVYQPSPDTAAVWVGAPDLRSLNDSPYWRNIFQRSLLWGLRYLVLPDVDLLPTRVSDDRRLGSRRQILPLLLALSDGYRGVDARPSHTRSGPPSCGCLRQRGHGFCRSQDPSCHLSVKPEIHGRLRRRAGLRINAARSEDGG